MSSRTRIRIAELLSARPRSLRELARQTRLSVPGVLRHIDALHKVGLIREERISSKLLPVRKVYTLKGVRVVDFSVGNLSITELVSTPRVQLSGGRANLEDLAGDIMILRRQVKDRARRLSKAIDGLIEEESSLLRAIDSLRLDADERLILLTAYTEETLEDAERVLGAQGMGDARMSIESTLSKAKKIVRR